MADQKLYHLWMEWEPGSRDNFFIKLSSRDEQRLREGLTLAVKEDMLNEFGLDLNSIIGTPEIVDYLEGLGLGKYVSPKNWSPKWEKR